MPETTNPTLITYIERARKVLQHEQRTNHQDQAIKPGGLEIFVVRWADETSAACKNAGLDLNPIHHFTEHLQGYRRQDPMQRAASLRAALAILNELDNNQPKPSVSPATTPTAKADNAPLRSSQSANVSSEAARLPRADGKALPSAPQNTI